MVNNADKKPLDIVEGVIEKILGPALSSANKQLPGKVYIYTATKGEVEVKFWPASDWVESVDENGKGKPVSVTRIPYEMSKEWQQLQGREGATVLIIAESDGEYQGKPQFQKAQIKSIDGASSEAPAAPAPSAPAPTPPAPAAPAPPVAARPIDGARWGNCMNNATLVNVNVPAEEREAVWKRILSDAAWLYTRTSEDIAAFMEPEPEPDFTASLGTLSEEEN